MIRVSLSQVGLAALPSSLRASERTLVLVHTSDARTAAESLALTALPAPTSDVRVVTPVELARSVLVAAGRPVPDLYTATERRRALREFLATTGDLPTHEPSAGSSEPARPALGNNTTAETVAAIGRALDDARLASAGSAEITVHALAADAQPWLLIAALIDPWQAFLTRRRATDRVGLLCAAMQAGREAPVVASWWTGVDHLIVTDTQRLDAPMARLVTSLLGPNRPDGAAATLWGTRNPVRLVPSSSEPGNNSADAEPSPAVRSATVRLIRCGHPAAEAEAAVALLQQAAKEGIAYSDMAVVSTSPERLRPIIRSARRAAIPVSGGPPPRLEGPVVAAMAQRARAIASDNDRPVKTPDDGPPPAAVTPSLLMRTVLRERSQAVTAATVEGETLVALYNHAERHSFLSCTEWADLLDTAPAASALPPSAHSDSVSLCTIDGLLDRRAQPRFTVVLGCVEGVLPSRRTQRAYDPAILEGPDGPATADHEHLALERLKFASIAMATDPAGTVAYVAAPEPGVLVSRFTEGIAAEAPPMLDRDLDPERWPVGLRPTANPRPLVANPSLQLSASQINVFDNCPWQHAIQYRLNLRTEGGLQARFGTFIHTVLERFVLGIGSTMPLQPGLPLRNRGSHAAEASPDVVGSPNNPYGSTLDGLLRLADECWSDDIADYAPQVDDYRRRARRMLTEWWERDGQSLVDSGRAVFTEYRFTVDVEGHTITGFIDRIDRVGSPESTDGLAIVDYKTGGSAKSVAETSDDLQLAVYHLAATLDPDLAAFGPVRSLALDFLAVDKQVMQPITEDHLQRTIARISEVATRMLAEETTPSVHASCDYCDFARLCDLQSQGRPVPVRIIGTERRPT